MINKLKNMAKKTLNNNEENREVEEKEVNETVEENISELDQLTNDLGESKDKYLRLYAEFENFKKRTVKEKLELMKNGAQDTISNLLPVLDDFDRAKLSAEDNGTDENFSEGVTLVYNKLHSTLTNMGVTAMESNGEPFDPELHEAITEIPAPDESMKGKIVDTVLTGYYLNDKIIRHAKVVVGK